ncbi:hypothetical protein [Paraburkholderia haematera]|uniref:DUF1488 family protein n=1 Tax=Paraburkholderia haematera TaxID=2793077 RepID=A0ABN7M7R4_9BURK|nr:hypothetical protein [Paraburkholderia haematera]CAE6782844.1 hypothetical protein R69888_04386 [Paraburkholderia haematera]
MYKLITVREAGDDIGVDFDMEIDDGKIQHFQVSSEAIEDLVKAPQKLHGAELIDAFHRVGSRVCEVAARKDGLPSNARALLKTSDF